MPLNLKTLLLGCALILVAVGVLLFGFTPRQTEGPTVVVYTSVDPEYALALFEKFTKESGIRVEPRTDSEASKSTGMAERLLQMKGRPDGDVVWNSELSLTQVLANADALEPYASPNAKEIPASYKDAQNRWTGFGCRARVILFNTNLVKREDVPRTLDGFADPKWKDKCTVPKPLFGTTRSHFVSLVLALGEEKAFKLFHAWRDNGVVIAESNSDVRERVANGYSTIGLTDSDDAFEALAGKKPVDFIVADQAADWHGAYLVPNTVAILKNCKHGAEAKKFVDFLLRPETEAWLAENGAHQIPVRTLPGVTSPVPLGDLKPIVVDVEQLGKSVLPVADKIYEALKK